jgi:hypothetical protein
MFALGMHDFLADIGGLFLVATALSAIGGYMDTRKNHTEPSFEGAFRALGIGALLIWVIIGFGFASWLVSLPFALVSGR